MSDRIHVGLAGFVERFPCPGCGGTFRHRLKCELKGLSIDEAVTLAVTLGLDEARKIAAERRQG
jgi:hypothetical protein